MVAVRLEGRLGNQLFQYAFIYATAKKLNTSFYIDKSVENFIPAMYFELQNDFIYPLDKYVFSINGYKNLWSIHIKKAFYKMLEQLYFSKKKIIVDNYLPITEVLHKVMNGYIYCGYFQSEKYFEECKPDIRKLLTIKTSYIKAFSDEFRKIRNGKKLIVIHIRRGDYVDMDVTLPMAYYKKALSLVSGENAQYIFISDEPQFIEKEFAHIEDKYISNNNEIIDLQFLINADICILANSSFGWWGAWLNNNKNKQVFAPKYWLGFKHRKEHPADIAYNLNFNWVQV